MNAVQLRCIWAKAALEVAEQERNRRRGELPPLPRHATDDQLQAYAEAAVRLDDESGYREALDELIEAERALIAWGKELVAQAPAEKQGQMMELLERCRWYPHIYEQVIDLLLRVDAEEVTA